MHLHCIHNDGVCIVCAERVVSREWNVATETTTTKRQFTATLLITYLRQIFCVTQQWHSFYAQQHVHRTFTSSEQHIHAFNTTQNKITMNRFNFMKYESSDYLLHSKAWFHVLEYVYETYLNCCFVMEIRPTRYTTIYRVKEKKTNNKILITILALVSASIF